MRSHRLVEDPDVGLHADGDERCVVADDPAAQNDDLRRRDAGQAAEEDSASALRLLERPGAHLRREPAGHLAHGCEQGELAIVRLDGLVGDADRAAVEQRPRERLVGCEMEVREEDEAFAQAAELCREGLLDLQHEVGAVPDLVDGGDPRADGFVGRVGKRAAFPCAPLDDDLVALLRNSRAPAGVRATRCSSGLISLATPIFMGLRRLSHATFPEATRPAA